MSAHADSSDKSLGLGLAFGALATVAALSMFVTDQHTAAYGYGAAVVFAALGVAAIQIYG